MLYRQQSMWQWIREFSTTTLSNTAGVSVTPGASSVVGAWTELAAASVVVNDVELLRVNVGSGATSTQSKMHLLDIGVDPAGGTAYVSIFGNTEDAGAEITKGWLCGGRTGNHNYYRGYSNYPIHIAAGSSIAVRVQGSNATAGTVVCTYQLFGKPSHPELVWVGSKVHSIGTISGTIGVGATPGDFDEGAWTEIGTAPALLRSISPGFQVNDAAVIGSRFCRVEFGFGASTTTPKSLGNWWMLVTTSEDLYNMGCSVEYGECEIPEGSKLYWRIRPDHFTAQTPTGWNCNVVGVS